MPIPRRNQQRFDKLNIFDYKFRSIRSSYNFIMHSNKSQRIQALLVLFCFFSVSLQQCTLSSANDQLQSGSTLVYNAHSATREHLYTLSTSINSGSSSMQVAASVSSFQVSPISGLDFSVRGAAGQSYGSAVIVLLISEDNTWSSIKISYLISFRTDFTLGFYIADTFFASKSSNSFGFQVTVPSWQSSQGSYTSIAEFSGVRTAANSFSISFTSLAFNPSTGVLSVGVSASTLVTVENIYITYIIFAVSSPIKYVSFNPSTAAPGTYAFVGLDSIKSTGSAFAGSSFTSASTGLNCIGSGCQGTCVSSLTCTNSGGQVSGSTCYLCPSGQTFANGYCQSTSQCGQNQYWSGSQCLCNSGYSSINGICYLSCGANAYITNNQCVCMPGYSYSSSTNQCVSSTVVNCGGNLVSVNGNCVCPSGYGNINNVCQRCPTSSYVNSIGNCQCVTGYSLDSSTLTCVTSCFANSTPNSLGQCVCNNGFYNQGNQCIAYGNCQNGMIYNGLTCVCPTGQYLNALSNQCTACNGYGQAIQGNNCVCTSTFYPTTTGCAPCTSNSAFNSATNQCLCLSGYNLVNGLCVNSPQCPSGAQWNSQTSACQCTAYGFYLVNNACTSCPLNSFWSGTTCQCQTGFTMSGSTCVSSCGTGAYWNGQYCACSTGYYMIAGNCGVCQANSTYSQADLACNCNSGYYVSGQSCYKCDSTCATCWGPAPTQCSTCPAGQNLNSVGGCTSGCPAGQYINANNICSPCMSNCIQCNSASICSTCATGYNQSLTVSNGNILMSCNPIPSGTSSTLSLRSYVVGNSVVYQGVAMSLMPTAILTDGCSICNDLLLVNTVSAFTSATTTVEYVANSQYWFLISFSFAGAAFIPTFQFTVQINPIYASYFSAADVAQKLTSSISPQTLYMATAPTFGLSISPSSSPSTPTASSTQFSKTVSNSQLSSIFTKTP